MHFSKFIEHLKNTRKNFRWTLDKEGALRARLNTNASQSQNTTLSLNSGSPKVTLFTPVTAVCYNVGHTLTHSSPPSPPSPPSGPKVHLSIDYAYAASDLDLDLATAREIELASDDVRASSLGETLVNILLPSPIP